MTTSDRSEVFDALIELAEHCPEMRLGQLMVNLAYSVRGVTNEAIWDMEDEELLTATKELLVELQSRTIAEPISI